MLIRSIFTLLLITLVNTTFAEINQNFTVDNLIQPYNYYFCVQKNADTNYSRETLNAHLTQIEPDNTPPQQCQKNVYTTGPGAFNLMSFAAYIHPKLISRISTQKAI